jgi:uncharacterized membrane protein
MKFIEKYENILNKGTDIIEIIAYTISFLLISITIIKTALYYIFEFMYNSIHSIDYTISFRKAILNLGESNSLALSFILGVEILRLFIVKTFKQLIFVACLVVVKLIISWFLLKEIESSETKLMKNIKK